MPVVNKPQYPMLIGWIASMILNVGAGWRISTQMGNLKKVTSENNTVVLITPEAQVRLTAYGSEIVRVRVSREKPASDFSYAVIGQPAGKLEKLSENNQQIVYSTWKVTVTVNKSPLRLKFTDVTGKVISEDDPSLGISWMGNAVTNYRKLFPDETLILHVYAGKEPATFIYYEDDGVSYAFEKGVYCKRVLRYDPVKKQIGITAQEGSFTSKFSKVKLVLHGFPKISGVKVNGYLTTINEESDKMQLVTFGWSDRETKILWD